MDLKAAGQAHNEWKVRFRIAIKHKEHVDAAEAADDDRCPLGQWLNGEGKVKYGSLRAFDECVRTHARFHHEAGKVAQLVEAGCYAEAEALVGSGTPFATSSRDAVGAIGRLKAAAEG